MKKLLLIIGIWFLVAVTIPLGLEAEPAQNAAITITWTDGKHSYEKNTFTDINGYYEFSLPVGDANVSAEYSKQRGNEYITVRNSTGKFVVDGTEWKNITLPAFPTDTVLIKGYVYDNETGFPIANANVSIVFHDHFFNGFNFTFTDSDGYYEIHAPASNITVGAIANGYYYNIEIIGIVGAGEIKNVDLYLEPLVGIVKGYIKDKDTSAPIKNAYVMIYSTNTSFGNVTFSNDSGYYEFSVIEGNMSVMVEASDYFNEFLPPFYVGAGETKWLNITMTHFVDDNAWIVGRVLDKNNQPIANANVSVVGSVVLFGGKTGDFVREGKTDAVGHYNVSVPAYTLPYGMTTIYSVVAEKEGYFTNSTSGTMQIAPGETKYIDVYLEQKPPENCVVKGYVYIETAPPTKKIHYVGGTGPGNYTTIQEAINAANDGDIIKVYPGTYDGPITINKEIKLIGDPAIDGHGGYGIKIEANNTLVENFTVFNCSYGIYARNFSFTLHDITIRNCTVYNCTIFGIWAHYINDAYIENNTVYNVSQAGIVIWDVNNGDVKNNEVFASGNALPIVRCSNLMVLGNKIHDNSGSGIKVSDNSIHNEIISNYVYNNTGFYGGIYVDTSYYNEINNNHVHNNSKYGIYIEDSRDNTISNNHIYKNGYDGIYMAQSSSNNSISSNSIYNNSQHGIVVYSSNNTINNNTIYHNRQNGIVIKNTATNNNITLNEMENNSLCGIYLIGGGNTVKLNSMVYNSYGIYILGSNNTMLSNEITKCNCGMYVGEAAENNEIKDNNIPDSSTYEIRIYGQNNTFINNTINSTKFSFTYHGNLTIKDAFMPALPPSHWQSIGKYLEIEKLDGQPAWMDIRIYYNDSDVAGLLENTLKIWRYDRGWYEDGWNGSRYLDTAKNVVGVNITNFSIFAPLAMAPNHLPYATNPTPANGSVDVSINPTLSVVVHDKDGDAMNVSFYDAASDTLIGYVDGVLPDNTASIVWSGLDYETTFYWYVIINDSYGENKSQTWHFTTVSRPAIVYVDDDYNEATPGWNDTRFNKIQDAINAVAEGGIVYVYEGIYKENICINKRMNIIGEDRDIVIIEGDETADVINISANYVNISGFTIRNSSLEPLEPFPAGIKVYYANHIKILDCLLSDNYAGILLLNSSNVIGTSNIVTDNEVDIMLQNSNSNVISENDCFHSNEGIRLESSHNNSILNNNCSDNDVGIAIDYSNNNTISHCILDNLDGIEIFHSDNNAISYCTISNNLIGIKIETNSVNNSILYSTISSNDAGINIYNSENISVYYCNIINNLNGTVVSGGRYIEIHYNNIYGNKYYGMQNTLSDAKYLVEATRNYWGSVDGPYNPVQNPDGEGDNITDNILFIPWFSSPIKIAIEKSIHAGMNDIDAVNETDIHVVVDTIKENILRVISFEEAPFEKYPSSIGKYVEIDIENKSVIEWPIYIKLYYTQDDLNNAGLTEDELVGIYFYNESAEEWQLFNDTGINTTDVVINGTAYAGYAWANAWHLTVITVGSVVKPSVVYVDDDYNASIPGWQYDYFASIQEGIDAVATGGIVKVYEGVYEESIVINKEVSIIAQGDPANTIIKASEQNAVTIQYPCTLDGFTIRDAHADYDNVRGIWVKADECIIRNVTITNISARQNDSKTIYTYGIMINHANNCTIENVTIYGIEGNDSTAYGIYAYESSNNSFNNIKIFNITSVSTAYGVYISYGDDNILKQIYTTGIAFGITFDFYSDYNTLENCVVSNSTSYGIIIGGATHNIIKNNSVHDNRYGITLWIKCYNNTIENNTVFNNYNGIYFYSESKFNTVRNNAVFNNTGNGIYLYHSSFNNISSNYIYNCQRGIRISSSNNNIFSNYIYNNGYEGIYIYPASNNNTISFNHIYENSYDGIYLSQGANNNSIFSNTIYNNTGNGIAIYSNNSNVYSNSIYNNSKYGVFISSGFDNTVHSNFIYANAWVGIELASYSSNNTIISNHIYNNSMDGVKLYNGVKNNMIKHNYIYDNALSGLYCYMSDENIIVENNFSENEKGISFQTSYNNTVKDNIIINNNYGIYLSSSANNLIYNNYFNNTINAWDNGNNVWNISKAAGTNIMGGAWLGGNYWHDYAGIDTNGDDLGDTMLPYNCSGNIMNGGDWHPLLMPANHPPAVPYNPSPSNGATGVGRDITLTWNCYDPDGDSLTYDVYFGSSSSSMIKKAGNVTATSYHITNLQYSTTYYWRVVAWDEHGASTQGPIWNFTTIENTPPSKPVLSGPSSGYAGNAITFSVKANDVNGDKIRYGIDWNNDGNVDEWTGYYSPSLTASISHIWSNEGTYSIKAIAEDEFGARSDWSNTLQITIHQYVPPPANQPPTCNITHPEDNATVSGIITVDGKASDDKNVLKVEIRIDGKQWIQTQGTIVWSYRLDTTLLSNGQHVIEARSYDGSLYSDIAKIRIKVNNNHKPYISITSPSNNAVVGGIIKIKGNAWDEDGNDTIERVEIKIDNGTWHIANGTTTWSYTIDTTLLSNGQHVIYARSYDGSLYSNIASIAINAKNEKEKGFPMLMLIAGIIIAIILIAAAMLLIRR